MTDQSFSFVGTFGHFYPSFSDSNLFTTPAIAIDSSDAVYVADNTTNQIAVVDIFGSVTKIPITTLPFPIAGPTGLAFDSSDNLFISDSGNSRVLKYTPAGVETVLSVPGLGKPGQLVLDKAKDLLYIVDQDNDRVLLYDVNKMAEAGEAFAGATKIQSVALDPSGILYLSDSLLGFLKGGSITTVLGIYAPIHTPGGIYIDRAGLIYLSDAGVNSVFRVDSQGHQTQISDLGNSSNGVAEDSQGRIILSTGGPNIRTFTPSGSVNNAFPGGGDDQFNSLIYTMPQAQTSLTSTAVPAGNFAVPANPEGCPYVSITGTCSILVEFTPTLPGERMGSVSTTLLNGPTISTLLYGAAEGPAPAFSPGSQTQTPAAAIYASAVALDQSGNYYVSGYTDNQVFKTSGGATVALPFSRLVLPGALAVDGAGAVYVLTGNPVRSVAKLDLANNQTTPVKAGVGNPLTSIDSFTIDGGGQIYFAGAVGGSTSIICSTGQAPPLWCTQVLPNLCRSHLIPTATSIRFRVTGRWFVSTYIASCRRLLPRAPSKIPPVSPSMLPGPSTSRRLASPPLRSFIRMRPLPASRSPHSIRRVAWRSTAQATSSSSISRRTTTSSSTAPTRTSTSATSQSTPPRPSSPFSPTPGHSPSQLTVFPAIATSSK